MRSCISRAARFKTLMRSADRNGRTIKQQTVQPEITAPALVTSVDIALELDADHVIHVFEVVALRRFVWRRSSSDGPWDPLGQVDCREMFGVAGGIMSGTWNRCEASYPGILHDEAHALASFTFDATCHVARGRDLEIWGC